MNRIDYLVERMSKPDMSEKCKEFIESYIKDNKVESVLEFGSGGSTKIFAELGCDVITIEHNPEFFFAGRKLWGDINNIKSFLAVDERSYICLAYQEIQTDLVFIDGLHREVLMTAVRNCTHWETIMVHDSERESYQPHFEYLKEIAEDISPKGINLFVCRRK